MITRVLDLFFEKFLYKIRIIHTGHQSTDFAYKSTYCTTTTVSKVALQPPKKNPKVCSTIAL